VRVEVLDMRVRYVDFAVASHAHCSYAVTIGAPAQCHTNMPHRLEFPPSAPSTHLPEKGNQSAAE